MPKESDGTPVDCGGFADSDLAVSAPPASRALALGHEQPAAAALSSWLSRIVRSPLEFDHLARHLLLAGCQLVDCARYLFLTGCDVGDDSVADARYYLLDRVGNDPRNGSLRR